ncbi:hypothetical protein EJF36_13510 [Bacillus sp. HMF5848]|uniref:hypothetical protein n=1 Tax=Bacillus sp. HMF5848 TaxID=2495421 RepID=UPI000F76ACC7|nr:hypothetical protein [Bacillus sp. HMF5848]RSK27812.1 hypothetical protein EJF36_13510 [Bacillus sp. HMF5848]
MISFSYTLLILSFILYWHRDKETSFVLLYSIALSIVLAHGIMSSLTLDTTLLNGSVIMIATILCLYILEIAEIQPFRLPTFVLYIISLLVASIFIGWNIIAEAFVGILIFSSIYRLFTTLHEARETFILFSIISVPIILLLIDQSSTTWTLALFLLGAGIGNFLENIKVKMNPVPLTALPTVFFIGLLPATIFGILAIYWQPVLSLALGFWVCFVAPYIFIKLQITKTDVANVLSTNQ